ncbi:unnamed protein product [Mytilus edulis]|uniref:Prolyl 4-hydroxylase alpha subunit domain-containing protein n=1 Tax=Mytilus edulis TaxID=6550 RepID=A0A8S3R6A5_MYTED|nr:unnamed protein product [Mytilus edulis]
MTKRKRRKGRTVQKKNNEQHKPYKLQVNPDSCYYRKQISAGRIRRAEDGFKYHKRRCTAAKRLSEMSGICVVQRFHERGMRRIHTNCREKGFEVALLNAGDRQVLATDVRNSSRCIWDTKEEVDKIWKRIKEYVPDVWCHREVMGLNERLRILRYDPGEYFRPHYDGMYKRNNGERSYVTVQIYLNEMKSVPSISSTTKSVLFEHKSNFISE